MSRPSTISVVVPLLNEEECVRPLVQAVEQALEGRDWELLLVDDRSTDRTAVIAAEICRTDPRVRLLPLARNYGQTAAMKAGFDHARGEVVVSMDGDLQNDPRDIPLLVDKLAEGFDLVAGYRENRQDKAVTRKFPSWVANGLIRWITGVKIRDTGCSLRAYRAEIVKGMVLYSDMHRFLPAIAATTSGARISEISVRHHPRRHGKSKYGLSRTGRVLLDLLTVAMIRLFRDRPLRMFGFAAGLALLCGLVFVVAMALAMATFEISDDRALVYPSAAIILFGLGAYLLMLGLVGEVLVRQYWHPIGRALPVVREVTR